MAAGVAPLQGLQEGMGALRVAMDIGAWFAEDAETPLAVKVFDGLAGPAGGIETIDESQAKADLARFGVDTPRGTLTHTGALLESADLSGADLGACNLSGASLVSSIMVHCNLQGATLSDADVSGASLKSANFADAKVDGIRFDFTLGFYRESDPSLGITKLISDIKIAKG